MNENTIHQIREAVENLPRYTGTKWTNGPDEWSLAFCKKLDALVVLSNDLADDVVAAGMIVKTPVGELRRGDLIVRHWADGTKSIDAIAEVVPAPEVDSSGREMGGHYVRTTNSGGQYRTLSQMWTTSETEDRIDVPRPLSIVLEEAAELEAELAAETPEKIYEAPSCFSPKFVEGGSVRFVETYSTGVLPDGGPTAPAGFETTVEETAHAGADGVLVRFPEVDGSAPRQYVPAHVLEVEPDYSDATHCIHGSYVGTWAGPDHMCGACEDGLSNFGLLPSEIEFEARVDARAREIVAEHVHDSIVGVLVERPYRSIYATAVVESVDAALAGRPPISFVRQARTELAAVAS